MGITSSRSSSRKPTTEDYLRHIPKLHFVSAASDAAAAAGAAPSHPAAAEQAEPHQQPDEDGTSLEEEQEARRSNFSSLAQFAEVRS